MNPDIKPKRLGTQADLVRDQMGDLLWILLVSTLILILGSIPTWTGYASQTADLRFRGLYFDSQDYAVHLSMMQSGQIGEWAYQLRFTTESHQPAFIKLFYILLGHVGKFLGLDNETAYHVARWIAGYFALASIFILCGQLFKNRSQARYAFLMAGLGSGLGWLLLLSGVPLQPVSPIDFWLIDLYVFFSLSVFPHFSFLIALMAISLSLYLKYLHLESLTDTEPKSKNFPVSHEVAGIGLCSFAAGFINPTALVGVDAAIFGATIFNWIFNRRVIGTQIYALCFIATVQSIPILYNFFVLDHDPIWSQFMLQNQTRTPPLSNLIWGLAPLLPFAILGGWQALRTRSPEFGSLLIWTLAAIPLAYSPISIQRRFLLGLTIPLGILAIYGFSAHVKNHKLSLALFGYVLLAGISSIYLSLGSSLFMRTHPPAYFYPATLDPVFDWLNRNAAANEFVLSGSETGLLVAAKTPQKVFLGHEMETIHFELKNQWVKDYYREEQPINTPNGKLIRYVIYGPYERQFAPDFVPEKNLKLVFDEQKVQVYEFLER